MIAYRITNCLLLLLTHIYLLVSTNKLLTCISVIYNLRNRIINNAPLLQMVTHQPHPLPISIEEEVVGEVVGGNSNSSSDKNTAKKYNRPSVSSSIPHQLLKTKTFDVRLCKTLILRKLKVLSMLKKNAMIIDETPHELYQHHEDLDRTFPRMFSAGNDDIVMFRPSTYHYLAAVIDFDSKVLVQALGALLSYLQSTVFQLEERGNIIINKIIDAKTCNFMRISSSTFSALHIFSTEHHPLIAKGQGNAKEGFSLYSLLDRTKSLGGRQLLREWMLKPLIDLDAIRTRHDAIEFVLEPTIQTSVSVLLSLLPKFGPIDKILLRIQKCTAKPKDFLVLTTTLSAAISMNSVIRNDIIPVSSKCTQYFSDLHSQCHVEELIGLRQCIMNVIDVELTVDNKAETVGIRRGFDEELDILKEQFEYLDITLAEVAEVLYNKHGQLGGLSVVFVPQFGYHVILENEISRSGIELPDDFHFVFKQDNEAFFKCQEVRKMDDDIGDLDGRIKDREMNIVTELEDEILEKENELRECFKALSSLDCILSMADCASDLDFTRPRLINGDDEHQVINIKDGRHPLQEIICEMDFVPNDVQIDDVDRILCVSGSNYSGKSCYLRQVGILVYMAHIGSYLPAKKSTISLTDQIFARVTTIETCSRPQSSYQLELTEMASIILKATPKSLVLIDEFGKGTNPASGIAMMAATLNKMSKIRCKAVCTTHFLELFNMNIVKNGEGGIRARRMAIHMPDDGEDSATPLFKLEDGYASTSAGLICARNAGMDHTVIERAEEIIQKMRAKQFIQPLPEVAKSTPKFSKAERDMLTLFASEDSWEQNASDDQIKRLLLLLAKLSD